MYMKLANFAYTHSTHSASLKLLLTKHVNYVDECLCGNSELV